MSRVVLFKGNIPEIIDSAHTPDYAGRPDAVINPDLSAVDGVPLKYWKKQNKSVVAMSVSERDAVDAAEQAAIAPREATARKCDQALKAIGISLSELRSAL